MSYYGNNFPYGESPFYKDDGTVSDDQKLHYWALKKIFPIKQNNANSSLGGEFDNDMDIEGKHLDNCYFQGMDLYKEIFPDTAVLSSTISSYERVFDCTSMNRVFLGYDDLTDKNRKMNPYRLVTDASMYGYDSSIFEGHHEMFIVSAVSSQATHLSGQLWSTGHAWTFWMDSTGSTTPADRTSMMNAITPHIPAFSQVVYNFA